jgi:hypothetical protein
VAAVTDRVCRALIVAVAQHSRAQYSRSFGTGIRLSFPSKMVEVIVMSGLPPTRSLPAHSLMARCRARGIV